MAISTSDTAASTRTIGFELLHKLSVPGENLCISPASISCALQLALAGAGGQTAQEMLGMMGITAPNRKQLANDCASLLQALQSAAPASSYEGPGANLQFRMANSIWAHRKVQLSPDFKATLATKYGADSNNIDFADPESLKQINDWVSGKTAGKIPSIINSLSPDNLLVLINCAYFKARWALEFNKNETVPHDFTLAQSRTISVPMMVHKNVRLGYFHDRNMQVANLPYTDDRFSMYIILPAAGVDITTLVTQLSPSLWDHVCSKLQEHQGKFAMPRFRINFGGELKQVLQSMGMQQAFTPEADFWRMFASGEDVPRPPFFLIDRVVHKTFIDVDEQGTEAAAATAILGWGAGLPPAVPPFEMIVDRPFMFVLQENVSQTMLFAGVVTEPKTDA